MKQLIDNYKKAIEASLLECARRKPDEAKEAAYLWGFLQGKYNGLNEGLKMVESFLNAEEIEEEFK